MSKVTGDGRVEGEKGGAEKREKEINLSWYGSCKCEFIKLTL
jgi:hypothetical protein